MIVIRRPRTEIPIPALATLLLSVLRLGKPKPIPRKLAVPPQSSMIAAHRLIIPVAAGVSANSFALRNSGASVFGS
jgi:hypothetical protein